MAVEIVNFGSDRDGRPIHKIILKNVCGTAVSVLDRGATIQAFQYRDKDIVLGYDTVEAYENANGSYIGATVGRVCNRIAGGRFELDGQEIVLACNETDKNGHLHGGTVGFDKKVWDYEVLREGPEPSVKFSLFSPDGEEGYPGNLQVSVTFTLDVENTLELAYEAKTDKATPVNLTNHTYFNLNGYDGPNVLDTWLKINAAEITPVNEVSIPTGDFMPVEGTPLDFRGYRSIGDGVNGIHPQISAVSGVDHNFVLDYAKHEVREAASAYSPHTGIRLVCSTDLPGIQVYTANFLDESSGKAGCAWKQYGGFCMETQFFPDSVNHDNFPSTILRPGEVYRSVTRFHVDREAVE